ncbi:MAG: DUF4446 family protein [Candidatus Moranbacteria bacterium]|nr:DUF4446 family protein [Candidatus Moranbacteria bacterium]
MGVFLLVYISLGLIGLLLVWIVLLQMKISGIRKNQEILFNGKKAKDLEKIILENKNNIKKISDETEDLYSITSKINQHSLKSIHKMGLIRFNPFREIGGDQSFSLALLDDEDTGAVLSSLYSREGVRIYAKSVQKGQPVKYPLTEEEKQAISIASIDKNNQKIRKNV